MDSRTYIELTTNDWVEIPLDPDTDGYTQIVIEALDDNIEWSTLNVAQQQAPMIKHDTAYMFDYPIFVRLRKFSFKKVTVSITRL